MSHPPSRAIEIIHSYYPDEPGVYSYSYFSKSIYFCFCYYSYVYVSPLRRSGSISHVSETFS
jgi:hypothetical protein